MHAGLCADCIHARPITTARSVFLFCRMSESDPRYRKYPALPVLKCAAFAPDA